MEKYPNSEFRGSLYVFDKRVTMHFDDKDKHEVIGKCKLCNDSCEKYVNCANKKCNLHFVCCDNCMDKENKAFCKTTCKYSLMLRNFKKSLKPKFHFS